MNRVDLRKKRKSKGSGSGKANTIPRFAPEIFIVFHCSCILAMHAGSQKVGNLPRAWLGAITKDKLNKTKNMCFTTGRTKKSLQLSSAARRLVSTQSHHRHYHLLTPRLGFKWQKQRKTKARYAGHICMRMASRGLAMHPNILCVMRWARLGKRLAGG